MVKRWYEQHFTHWTTPDVWPTNWLNLHNQVMCFVCMGISPRPANPSATWLILLGCREMGSGKTGEAPPFVHHSPFQWMELKWSAWWGHKNSLCTLLYQGISGRWHGSSHFAHLCARHSLWSPKRHTHSNVRDASSPFDTPMVLCVSTTSITMDLLRFYTMHSVRHMDLCRLSGPQDLAMLHLDKAFRQGEFLERWEWMSVGLGRAERAYNHFIYVYLNMFVCQHRCLPDWMGRTAVPYVPTLMSGCALWSNWKWWCQQARR